MDGRGSRVVVVVQLGASETKTHRTSNNTGNNGTPAELSNITRSSLTQDFALRSFASLPTPIKSLATHYTTKLTSLQKQKATSDRNFIRFTPKQQQQRWCPLDLNTLLLVKQY
jgi:hypothetical protein